MPTKPIGIVNIWSCYHSKQRKICNILLFRHRTKDTKTFKFLKILTFKKKRWHDLIAPCENPASHPSCTFISLVILPPVLIKAHSGLDLVITLFNYCTDVVQLQWMEANKMAPFNTALNTKHFRHVNILPVECSLF